MEKQQWLIAQILHLSAQLAQQPDEDQKQQIQTALSMYTQALREIREDQKPPYYS